MTIIGRHDVVLDPDSFRAIADLAFRESGLTLVKEKTGMVQSRLRHRLRDLGLPDFSSYCDLVTSEKGLGERRHLISALTTNVSHFFREDYHFDILVKEIKSRADALRSGARFRIWSAGCSNGQEALSTAMTLLETVPDATDMNIRILATDIDPSVVDFARKGVYAERQMDGVSAARRDKFFVKQHGVGEPFYSVKPALRKIIRFNELNLLCNWPFTGAFDIIFCRNVVIYFNADTQAALWPRFKNVLAADGSLFLGHSERISQPEQFGFQCVGQTTYRTLD